MKTQPTPKYKSIQPVLACNEKHIVFGNPEWNGHTWMYSFIGTTLRCGEEYIKRDPDVKTPRAVARYNKATNKVMQVSIINIGKRTDKQMERVLAQKNSPDSDYYQEGFEWREYFHVDQNIEEEKPKFKTRILFKFTFKSDTESTMHGAFIGEGQTEEISIVDAWMKMAKDNFEKRLIFQTEKIEVLRTEPVIE
jgi:hypothetical protein